MNRIEDGRESYLKTDSGSYRLATYFLNHHCELVTKSDVARILGYRGMYEAQQVDLPIQITRRYIAHKLGSSDALLSIFGEGWVSYDAVSPGARIAPRGLRPDPYWKGDPAVIGKLRQLYASLRFATVSQDTVRAVPPLTPTLSFYLELLSHAFAADLTISSRDIEDILDVTKNNLTGLDFRLKAILDRETQGHWTVSHMRGNSRTGGISGITSLVYNG
jgi:hypothetical protein